LRRTNPDGRRPRTNPRTSRHHVEPTCPTPNLTAVRPVARNQLRPGTVIWAHIPYAEIDEEKTRPAIVQSVCGHSVTVHPATTSVARRRYPNRYVELIDLTGTGLRRATGVQVRPLTIDTMEIVNIAGHLSDADHDRLLEVSCHPSLAPSDAA